MIEIIDRVVETPNRYRLVPVVGMEGVYDFLPVPGQVTAEGTDVNRKLFLDILKEAGAGAAFNIFATNANTNSLDAAFGKGRAENEVYGIGLALAWYAWFKGDNKTNYPYINIQKYNTLKEICINHVALLELVFSNYLMTLVTASPFANSTVMYYINADDEVLFNMLLSDSMRGVILGSSAMVTSLGDNIVALLGKASYKDALINKGGLISSLLSNTTIAEKIYRSAPAIKSLLANASSRVTLASYIKNPTTGSIVRTTLSNSPLFAKTSPINLSYGNGSTQIEYLGGGGLIVIASWNVSGSGGMTISTSDGVSGAPSESGSAFTGTVTWTRSSSYAPTYYLTYEKFLIV